MINYTFNISEEIARWVTEVYVRNRQSLGWWVAFTNPIAGPWKKITALDGNGVPVEIYRFERDGERPDLILVNDKYKLIIIIEAKDHYQKLIAVDQINKSIRVINDISTILRNCGNDNWSLRKDYKIIPSFLWFCEDNKKILDEDKIVRDVFAKYSKLNKKDFLNIVICRDENNILNNNFVYQGKVNEELIF